MFEKWQNLLKKSLPFLSPTSPLRRGRRGFKTLMKNHLAQDKTSLNLFNMTTVLQIANKQMTSEELIVFLTRSHLLPQVIRD